jgi:hypothetical protein
MASRHSAGTCTPCLFVTSKSGCLNGSGCRFCHLYHARKNRPRPCKAKRTQCKQMLGMLESVLTPGSEEFQNATERLSSESTYMRSLIQKHKPRNDALQNS